MNDGHSEPPIHAELVSLDSFREVDADIGWVRCFVGYLAADGAVVRHGPFQHFDERGRLREQGECKNGWRHGPWHSYHENGTLGSITEYVDGNHHGRHRSWSDTGILKFDWQYVDNLLQGQCRDYHGNGALRKEAEYEYGVQSGPCRIWDDAGMLLAEGVYADDLPLDGTFLIDEPVEPGPDLPTFNHYVDRFLNRRFVIAEFREGKLVRNLGVYPRSQLTPRGSER